MTAKRTFARGLAGLAAAAFCSSALAAANIVIINGNAAGVGFNDPTPVAPVGGNPGLTLGQQRLNAFQYAASIWGATLDSAATIRVLATFEPLSCNATGAVLGSAGALTVYRDFPNAPDAGTWYSAALADRLAGVDLDPAGNDLRARFNSNLGNAGCLTGSPFYLGLDNNVPAGQVNLVATLLHEFGHGLGFQTFTSGTTGAQLLGFPAMWDRFLLDNSTGKNWVQMTNAERAASAINPRKLVWSGANVTTAAPNVLSRGSPKLTIVSPASIAGDYDVGTASFGPPFGDTTLNRQIMPIVEANALSLACAPFGEEQARQAKNRIAVVIRGVCGFTIKVKNAQDAGAVGVIVVDNVAGGPPAGLGGADPTITIPAVRITLADGIRLIGGMSDNPSLRTVNVLGRFLVDAAQLAGADTSDRVLMYTPNPFQSGSSVSHWDTSATRNLLMEPAINVDLTQSVAPPEDLTLPLFRDIGW